MFADGKCSRKDPQMSYETLVIQDVVASIEATDAIRRRFVTFAKQLLERPDDLHFRLGGRNFKIAAGRSQFANDDYGGCAGQIVMETESDQPDESRLGYKLTHGARDGRARLTLTFNPSQLLAGADVAPTLRPNDDESAPEFPSSSQFVTAKLLGLGFDVLNDLYEAKHMRPLIYSAPPFNDGDIRVERVVWDALIRPNNPREFLLFLVLLFEPVFTANDTHRPSKLADLLKLKTSCGTDPKTGELTRVTFMRFQGKRRKLFSIEFSPLELGAAEKNEEEDFATAGRAGLLRLRVTAHPTGLAQLIGAGRGTDLDQDDVESSESHAGDGNHDADTTEGGARTDRNVFAISRAIEALAEQAVDGRQNRGSFPGWLVRKMLRDFLRLDVVGGFEQKDVETVAATSNEVARAWADGGMEPMDFVSWTQDANLDYEKARRYRNKVRDEHKIDIGVPRAFYDGVTVAATGAMDPNALCALAGALAKADPSEVGRRLIDGAKRFAEGRRNVIGATVQSVLAGQLGDFPVKEVRAEIEALPPRKKRAARRAASSTTNSLRATKKSKPGAKPPKPLQVKPLASGRKSAPTAANGSKRGASPTSDHRVKR
jgi:hypothetical protein